MEKTYDYDKSYEVALRKFKQACADAEVITEAKSSLEDCIIGLKRTIPRLRVGRLCHENHNSVEPLLWSHPFACLCLMSLQQRGHLETAPQFTVPCEGREAR